MDQSVPILSIKNLYAGGGDQTLLKDISLDVYGGQVQVLMGPVASGKSALAQLLAGNESYSAKGGEVLFKGLDLLKMSPEARSWSGLFVSFEDPLEIPGVNNSYFLRTALNSVRKHNSLSELNVSEFIELAKEKMRFLNLSSELLEQTLNQGHSENEKKMNEILQMELMEPDLVVFDEIDSGLDENSLQLLSGRIHRLLVPDRAFLVMTECRSFIECLYPDKVHLLYKGQIVFSGGMELVEFVEKRGFEWVECKLGERRRSDRVQF